MSKFMRFALVLAMLAVVLPGSAWAANVVNDVDTVTVAVQPTISISDATGNFSLTFTDTAPNALTNNFQTVGYVVQANTMPNSALTGALSARISALLDGINLLALTDRVFNNAGSASNAVLTESPGGTVTVGTSPVPLMDKPASTGSSGMILSGTAFVSWRAQATRDLTSTDGGSVMLTVTLKDA